jgi:hypothetical protein
MHVISLGTLCHTSTALKELDLKSYSCPFDWIFSRSLDVVAQIIQNDFIDFLDRSHYRHIAENKCGHALYHHSMFNHRNPLQNDEDYAYYERCVQRFRAVLCSGDAVDFVVTLKTEQTPTSDVLSLFHLLCERTHGRARLLVILCVSDTVSKIETLLDKDDVRIIRLHVTADDAGVRWANPVDEAAYRTAITDFLRPGSTRKNN